MRAGLLLVLRLVLLLVYALVALGCAGCSERAQSASPANQPAQDQSHAGESEAFGERYVHIGPDGRVTMRMVRGGPQSRASSSGMAGSELSVEPAFTVEIVCDSFGEVRAGSRPGDLGRKPGKDTNLEDHLVHWRIDSRVYSWWSEFLAELRRRRADPAVSYTDPVAKAVLVRPVVVRMGPNTTFQDFVRTVDFLLDAGFEDLRARQVLRR